VRPATLKRLYRRRKLRHGSEKLLPVFLAASQLLVVHNRVSYDVWRDIGSEEKHLEIVDSDYYG
jgi:hypothetical protein